VLEGVEVPPSSLARCPRALLVQMQISGSDADFWLSSCNATLIRHTSMSLNAPSAQAVGDKLTRAEVLGKMVEMQMLGMRPPDQVVPWHTVGRAVGGKVGEGGGEVVPWPASGLAHEALRALRSQRRRSVQDR